MSDVLLVLVVVTAVPVLVLGPLRFLHHPLAVVFEAGDRRRRRRSADHHDDDLDDPAARTPFVSVVVPAYNEAAVLEACVASVLADTHEHKEVIVVDDGSTDHTWQVMRRFADDPQVTLLRQPNAGKAAALNAGIDVSVGEVLLFCDADGIFGPDTVRELLTGFDGPDVGAVCGNDEPVNLDGPQPRLLALLTHATSMVRRALSLAGCLTIVSGNVGAFRRDVLEQTGLFTPGLVGEDLELTWRVHRAGYQVRFRPRAMVYAEVPVTIATLFRQRVRWTRGLIQTAVLHHDLLFRARHGRIAWYLPYNLTVMLLVPPLQVLSLTLLGCLVALGGGPRPGVVLTMLALGIAVATAEILFAVALDGAWRDLRHLVTLPLWIGFSLLMSVVVVWSLVQELRGAPARWNKMARTGVVSRRPFARAR